MALLPATVNPLVALTALRHAAKQPVFGELVPAFERDSTPRAGTTERKLPFQVIEKYCSSLGHTWRKGPPCVDDVAHEVPALGRAPLSVR